MKKIRIYVGNVNCKSGDYKYAGNTKLCPLLVDIFPENLQLPDIVILTEFYKWDDYQEFVKKFNERDYKTATNLKPKRKFNDVFIAISNKLKLNIDAINYAEQESSRKTPDFTVVELSNDEQRLIIMGTRIRSHTDPKTQKPNYKGNADEFSELIDLIKNQQNAGISNIILAGDFNNARVHGDRQSLWAKELPKYQRLDHNPHNYHLIKHKFNLIDLRLCTPEGDSWPIDNGKQAYIPNDHLIISKHWKIDSLEYKDNTKFSDHKALLATIELVMA